MGAGIYIFEAPLFSFKGVYYFSILSNDNVSLIIKKKNPS